MAIKIRESVKYLTEMKSNSSELMETEGFESLEPVECAFRALREILPQNESRQNLSDLEVLKLAMEYIQDLEQILHYESGNNFQWNRDMTELNKFLLLARGLTLEYSGKRFPATVHDQYEKKNGRPWFEE